MICTFPWPCFTPDAATTPPSTSSTVPSVLSAFGSKIPSIRYRVVDDVGLEAKGMLKNRLTKRNWMKTESNRDNVSFKDVL